MCNCGFISNSWFILVYKIITLLAQYIYLGIVGVSKSPWVLTIQEEHRDSINALISQVSSQEDSICCLAEMSFIR